MPFAEMLRWFHGPGSRTLVASGGPSDATVTGSERVGFRALAPNVAVADLGDGAVPITGRLAAGHLGEVAQGLQRALGLLDLLDEPSPDQCGDHRDHHQ